MNGTRMFFLTLANVLLVISVLLLWWYQPLFILSCDACAPSFYTAAFVISISLVPILLFLQKKISFLQMLTVLLGSIFFLLWFILFLF